MADSSLIQVIRRIVKETVDEGKPADYILGNVVGVDPLEVKISNNLTIDEEFLDVCQTVTDYEVKVDITDKTEYYPDEEAEDKHRHDIKIKKKTMKIYNSLKVGDKVAMLRRARGQKYLIIDKVVSGE